MDKMRRKRLLLVFVHGFLGSQESFESFPADVVDLLEISSVVAPGDVDFKVFPKFDTKGNNALAVKKLTDWLLLHATTMQYKSVVLMAHSMGGLLCADAYSLLYRLKKPEAMAPALSPASTTLDEQPDDNSSVGSPVTTEPKQQDREANKEPAVGWFARSTMTLGAITNVLRRNALPSSSSSKSTSSSSSSVLSSNDTQESEEPIVIDSESIRLLVRISGIIAFDSPFYGLASNVITSAGKNKVFDFVGSAAAAVGSYITPGTRKADAAQTQSKSTKSDEQQEAKGGAAIFVMEASGIVESVRHGDITAVDAVDAVELSSSAGQRPDTPETDAATGGPVMASSSEGLALVESGAGNAPASFNSSSSWSYAQYALLGGAAAAAAFYTVPVAAAVVPAGAIIRGFATQWALAQVEEVRNHAEFLYPLVNSQQQMHGRVALMLEEMDVRKRLHFHGFYLEVQRHKYFATSASTKSVSDIPSSLDEIPIKPRSRNFCVPPPTAAAHAFSLTYSDQDEIDGHMGLFNSATQGDHYKQLLQRTVEELRKVLAVE
ncbi:hypothetical protein DFJ73DRAFT_809378 [Zopfochytrium polystomum]|nr:hypothetical protein DFJ73DRAFT_809378 [Zopfochytrium polystomum]